MTHLSSTSAALYWFSSSLPNKALSLRFFKYPTQVHLQFTFSQHLYHIDYSHEFVGSVLAWFECSTLSDHNDTRTVVLRFVKIITPVKCVIPHYDGYICHPKEGELYQRSTTKPKCISQYGMSILTNPKKKKVLSYEVFNYSGRHSLFDA